MNLETLFAGKYAAYVWPAYGISLTGLIATVALTWRAYRKAKARLRRFERYAARPSRSDAENML